MKKLNKQKKQSGFSILAVILVIVAVIVAIGVWALSGQTNTNNSSTNTANIIASSVMQDADALKSTYDKYVINGYSDSNIAYEIGWKNQGELANILDPNEGVTIRKANAQAITSTPGSVDGYWINVYFAKTALGTNLGTERLMVLSGVKDTICKRINYNLYGSETIPDLGQSSSDALFAMSVTANVPYTNTILNFPANIPQWTSGCIGSSTAPDKNLYFIVLKIS